MLQVDIPAAVRTVFGKGEARRLRMDKKTPAVMYSKGDDALALQFDEGILHKNLLQIHRRNAVVTLDIEGDAQGKRHVLVQEIQKDPVVERVLHVDFLEIELDKPVDFIVPLRLTGVAKGVELGGLLRISKRTLTLRGCPLDVPDEVVADITELDRGEKGIYCADLEIPAKVEMLDDPATLCVQII
jgi:large subunit ribosomal protein L25